MVRERGQRIPIQDLTPTQNAMRQVEGGHFYRALKRFCPRCNGTGRRDTAT